MRKITLLMMVMAVMWGGNVLAQLTSISSNLPNIGRGQIKFADFNNDGNLDALIVGQPTDYATTGTYTFKLFTGNGSGVFTDVTATWFPGGTPTAVACGMVDIADYNRDGYLDICYSGWVSSTSAITKIYKNNGDNTFTDYTTTAFNSVTPAAAYSGTIKWADLDNDGDLDLIIFGRSISGTPTLSYPTASANRNVVFKIYINNGSGVYTDSGQAPSGLNYCNLNISDFDGDGDLDLIATGSSGPGVTINVNNGSGTFENTYSYTANQKNIKYTAGSSSVVADFNNDGKPDIFMSNLAGKTETGFTIYTATSSLYLNTISPLTSNSALTNWTNFTQNYGIIPAYGTTNSSAVAANNMGIVSVADYNNDGYLDVTNQGLLSGTPTTTLYTGAGSTVFTAVTLTPALTGLNYGGATWADINNDGKPDLTTWGYTAVGATAATYVYANSTGTSNSAPSAPSNLQATVNGSDITFTWDASTDDHTPSTSLSYNIKIGTTSGGVQIVSPSSKVVGSGAYSKNSCTIKGLADGIYYWSVQSVDANNLTSSFSAQSTIAKGNFSAPTTQPSNLTVSSTQTTATLNWTNGNGSKNIVLYSTNSDVSTANPPINNTTYTVGNVISSGYIVGAITSSQSANISGLTPGVQYYFAVFGYNDFNTTGIEKYNTVSPISANTTTPPNSLASDQFKTSTAGRWDATSTWLSSSDGNSWHIANLLPQQSTTSVLVTATANPITVGSTILPPNFSMENGAKLKISRVFNSDNYTFDNTITGSGSATIQLDTIPNIKPYTYTLNPTFSGISTVNYILNPLLDVTGIRIVGGGTNYNVGFGSSTKALTGLQFNVSTLKTSYQGFPLADDAYLQNAKLYLGDYITLTRINVQGSGTTSMYIGELSSAPTPSANPPKIQGSASVSGRPLAFYIGYLNTDATYSGQFSNSGGSDTYIHKVGTGNWTLSGANTTYTGSFTVDAGTVTLNGSLGTIPVTVLTPGTLTGTGSIAGATTINGILSGTIAITGATSVSATGTISGTHNFGNDLTLAGTTNLTITDFTSNYNVITVAGTVTNGGTLNITIPASAPTVGTNIKLINAGAYANGSTFATKNLPSGYRFDDATGILYYDGTTLNSSTSISSSSLPSNACITVSAGNTLTIDQAATVNKITVAPGAQVTLNSGINLTANTVELQSSASGTATFVDADATGKTVTGTVQQYLPTGRNWYVGIPIANGDNSTTASSLTAGGATSVSYWDEPTGAWVNDYAGSLTKGRGYIAVSGSGSATNNISFSGTFNTGSVPVTVTRTVGATKEGFNLIANPYPSYLNPCDLITASSKMEPTIWYRTKGAAYSFETVNTASGEGTNGVTGYIPPMQAFWVRVKANATDAAQNNSETLTFTNAMRYHANPSGVTTTALKAPKSTQNMLLRLQVSNGVNADEAIIYANTNASNAYDAYDSHKMSNNSALIPEIYTTVGSEQLVINGLNEIPLNTEIPVGFSNLQSGTNSFKLRASELRNISSDTKVFLLDKSTNAETELTTASDYTFTSEATNTTSRFSVIFKSVGQTTGTVDKSDKKAIVYTNNGQIIFVANEVPTGDNNSLMIFDATGRKVADRSITSTVTGINNINIPGVYLVRAIVNGQPYSAKINLNH